MALPVANKGFEQGNLDGFVAKGKVQVESSYLGRHRKFTPVAENGVGGQFFARLDDPRAINGDGEREILLGEELADTSYIQLFHPDGSATFGVDGAYIECADVTIPNGCALFFWYNFIAFDPRGVNDFAVLEFFPDDATDQPPTLRKLIYDTRLLDEENRVQTGWRSFPPLQFPQGFQGTVRWVMSNGRTANMSANAGSAYPSCLLIDAIDILGI